MSPSSRRTATGTARACGAWRPSSAASSRALQSGHLAGRALGRMLKLVATLAYYGDDGVLASLGYDPEAKLARGRELRAAEGRPA